MDEPIRILHAVGSLGAGGIQSCLMNLYRHVDRLKVQFDFVVHIRTEESFESEIQSMGGRVFHIDGDAFEKKTWLPYMRWWKRFFREHPEYRIIHGHLRSTAALYLGMAKRRGVYTVAHSHAVSNGYGMGARVKDLLQYPVRYIADYCMGCSYAANEWMFGKKRARSDNCLVLKNGIDVRKFRYDATARADVRRELGLPENSFVIGSVGRLVAQKNQLLLIEAMQTVLQARPEAKLVIVGDGPLRESLSGEIAARGLRDAVLLAGARNDVNRLLSAMDVFALPSRDEGLGIAAIEAQANGLPTLVSAAVPEEAYATEQIRRVAPDTSAAWAQALTADAVTRAADAAGQVRAAGYDIAGIAEQLEEFYLGALSQSFR